MSRLLVVEASPQGESSISRKLTEDFVAQWRRAFPEGEIHRRDLSKAGIPLIDAAWILGAFTSPDDHSSETQAAMRISDSLIAELFAADHVLIGTPMHNLMIPAVLKAYIDQIVRIGSTVSADNLGLVKDKKVAVILASGGDFSPGSAAEQFNHASPYLRTVLGYIGLTDLQFILAGPTRPVMLGEESADHFVARFASAIETIIANWAPVSHS